MPDPRHRRHWHHRARLALKRSLRLRLLLVFLALALGMTLTFLAGTQRALGGGWRLAVVPLLSDYVDRLATDIGSPPSIERAQALAARLPISIRIDGPAVHWSSAQAPGPGGFDRHWRADDGPKLLERTTADGHRIVFGWGELPWKNEPGLVGWVTLGVLLLLIALAYTYLRRLLRPLEDIRAGAQRFGRGAFDQPIAVRREDELGDLARQVNTMASDLHRMLDGQRALLVAISHELRSPLTRARLHAELLPEEGPAQAARGALLRDLGEMRDLISDLLESERLSGAGVALQRAPTALDLLVRELLQARADTAPWVLAVDADLPPVAVDPVRWRLAARNLLDNALRHGAPPGVQPPVVRLTRSGDELQLVVRDHGPGVDEAQLARLAEPFYRTDDARQRSTGGVGLGLHLARLVAQAHGGRLAFRLAHPGLEVTLAVPLSAH